MSAQSDIRLAAELADLSDLKAVYSKNAKPGRMNGKDRGYTPPNAGASQILTKNGIGKDPLTDLTPEQLTQAGHPRRSSAAIMTAMRRYMDLDTGQMPEGMTGKPRYTNMRDHCKACAENLPEIRNCAIIDCPFWPYRLGKNPHNPKRGKMPKGFKTHPTPAEESAVNEFMDVTGFDREAS